MLWDRWREQLCLQPAGLGPCRSLEPSPGGRWVLVSEPGQELGLGFGSKRIFRLWQLVLGGDRSAAGACSSSSLERCMSEALGGSFLRLVG